GVVEICRIRAGVSEPASLILLPKVVELKTHALKAHLDGVRSTYDGESIRVVPGIIALYFRQRGIVRQGCVVADQKIRESESKRIRRYPGDAQVRGNVGAECAGRNVEHPQTRE